MVKIIQFFFTVILVSSITGFSGDNGNTTRTQQQIQDQLKDGSCENIAADQTRDQLKLQDMIKDQLKDGSCGNVAADQTRDQLKSQDMIKDQLKDGSCKA